MFRDRLLALQNELMPTQASRPSENSEGEFRLQTKNNNE
jgi:hypothetical protein